MESPGLRVCALALPCLLILAATERIVMSAPDDESLATAGFQRLRPPLLGLAIEHSVATGKYRLITAGDKPEVLLTGALEECETVLLDHLKTKYGTGRLNAAWPTLGGKQFWADRHIFAGWHVQENVYTGHCRLLDARDVRQAWGTYEACRVALEEARQKLGFKPRSPRLAVLLHGLFRSKDSFGLLVKSLEEAGYEVAAVNYPSTRKSLREHSLQLEEILDSSEGAEEVSFVTHSLGGLVVRDLLGRDGKWKQSIRVHRLVMLAPPNQGSVVAETLKEWLPFQAAAGQAGQELTPRAVARIPAPECEFGIIAGGAGNESGFNPLLPGDDDMVVTVESTRLAGAADFLVIPATHTFIMDKPEAREAVLNFLARRRFSDQRTPAPIPRAAPGPDAQPSRSK